MPGLRGRIQGYLDHVIIDEYQDINVAQQRLLALLAGERAEVMAVGDANQCIYEWRGAHPETMLQRFTATFGEAVDYPLSTTFRHGHAPGAGRQPRHRSQSLGAPTSSAWRLPETR